MAERFPPFQWANRAPRLLMSARWVIPPCSRLPAPARGKAKIAWWTIGHCGPSGPDPRRSVLPCGERYELIGRTDTLYRSTLHLPRPPTYASRDEDSGILQPHRRSVQINYLRRTRGVVVRKIELLL